MGEDHIITYNIYEERKKRKKYFSIAIIIMILLGIGYAFLQTSLNISGTTNVSDNNWDIYWDNLYITPRSIETEEEGEDAAEIDPTTKIDIEFTINLKKPGEFYEFIVEANNDGSIDAMIDSINKIIKINGEEANPSYIDYTIMYDDKAPISKKQILKAGQSETYRVKVEYKQDINSSDLPKSDVTLTCEFGVDYIQADSSAIEVSSRVYHHEEEKGITMNQPLPNTITTYNNYDIAMETFDSPVFIKQVVLDNKVRSIQIGFRYNGKIYYLRAGGEIVENENTIQVNDYYARNRQLMIGLFGMENCYEDEEDNHDNLECELDGWDVYVDEIGDNVAEKNDKGCLRAYMNGNLVTGCYDDTGD